MRNDQPNTDAEAPKDVLADLNRLAAEITSTTGLTEVAEAAVRLARQASRATSVAIVRLDAKAEELETVASDGLPPDIVEAWSRFPLDAPAPVAECVVTGEPVFVSSPTERRARFRGIADRTPATVSRSWAAFPLRSAGVVSGAIGFGFPHARTFPAADQELLWAIAEEVSAALEAAARYRDR